MKAGNLTTNQKVKVNFCLPEFSVTKTMMWECHVDKYTKSRHAMIFGRDILREL